MSDRFAMKFLLFIFSLSWIPSVLAQTVVPSSLDFLDDSDICDLTTTISEVCITLPPSSTISKVDLFLLFDDTGSFTSFVPTVKNIFSELVDSLQVVLPDVDFGFGVGRFEDYNDSGGGAMDQPFILNQPIVTEDDAIDASTTLVALIDAALDRSAPGGGADSPETAIEALYQVATGAGFDSDLDGITTGDPSGSRLAGSLATQTSTTGYNGDVPAFSTLEDGVLSSGTVGGAGFRSDALKLVILATDICSVAPFDIAEPNIISDFATVASSDFECHSRSGEGVAPPGAATVQDAVDALVGEGIRVIGMHANEGEPLLNFLSATALLTNAVNDLDDPLCFPISLAEVDSLETAIVEAVEATATLPIDIELTEDCSDIYAELSVSVPSDPVYDVAPGETACFEVSFVNANEELTGTCEFTFTDINNGLNLGSISTGFACEGTPEVPCGDHPCGKNLNKVYVCHVPSGDFSKQRTLCVGNAIGHIKSHNNKHNEDYCGKCVSLRGTRDKRGHNP